MIVAMPPETIRAVLRASRRSAVLIHEDLRDGLSALATVAYLAPWFGLLATASMILESNVGCGCEKSTWMASLALRLSRSIWPTAIGLTIGLISAWANRYLNNRLEGFDREMEGGALDLANQLSRYQGRWSWAPAIQQSSEGPIFAGAAKAEVWCHSPLLVGSALFGAWVVEMGHYFYQEYVPLTPVPWLACKYVAFTFLVAFLPAYLPWAKLPYRRPLGLLDLAAAICLCWCLVEAVLGIHLL